MVHLICFRLEIPFLSKFGSKNQNSQFKLKFGTETNSNIQNSMRMFTYLGFDPKYFFGHIWSKNSNLFVQGKICYLD